MFSIGFWQLFEQMANCGTSQTSDLFGSPAVLVSFVASNVAEEARIRGFPSPSFGGFGFIVSITNYSRKLLDCLIGNIIGTYSGVGDGRLGSLAAPQDSTIPMSAIGGKADVQLTRNVLIRQSANGREQSLGY